MLSDAFDYSSVKQPSSGITATRRVDRMKSQSTFKPSQKLVWDTPRVPQGFLDLKNFYIKFSIVSAGLARFDGDAKCLFKSIRVETSKGIQIDLLENANVWYGLSNHILDEGSLNGYDRISGSMGDDNIPFLGADLQTVKTFIVSFNHGIFATEKMIPLFGEALK